MPYVEVWVDEGDCDGTCGASQEADRLRAQIDEAANLIRSGNFDAALHALTGDSSVCVKPPDEIAEAYKQWKAGRLKGFTNYRNAPAPEATP